MNRQRLSVAVFLAALGLAIVAPLPADAEERYQPAARSPREVAEEWRPLVEQYAWDPDTALAVIACESHGNPEAVNPTTGAAGLWQLYGWQRFANRLFGEWVSLFDPAVNTRVAWALFVDSGHRFGFHWYASMGCWARGGW